MSGDFFARVAEILTEAANWSGPAGFPARIAEHVRLSALAVALAGAIALPVGMYIGHTRRFEFVAVNVANFGRALPSFAIIVFFLPFSIRAGLGIGFWPTAAALFLLAIPPILTNTYVGLQSVDRDAVESARGMGMREREILLGVEAPLAAPLIVAGFRTAAVQVVATATLGAVVGWGGLGRYIIDGFAIGDRPLIFTGGLLVALLAIATEVVLGVVERIARPRTSSGRASFRRAEVASRSGSP